MPHDDDRPLEAFLMCRIGDVLVSVRTEPALSGVLDTVKNRLEPFAARGETDITLDIRWAEPSLNKTRGMHLSDSARRLREILPRRAAGHPLVKQLIQNLSPPAQGHLAAWMAGAACGTSHALSLVPHEAGCLLFEAGSKKTCLFLYNRAPGETFAHSPAQKARVNRTMLNAIMAAVALFLPSKQGALVHGVGLVRQGKGYLFMAPSKGGKTTLSMHSSPGSVLADDGIVVRHSPQGYQIHATPLRQRPGGATRAWEWHQEAAPLCGAFLIRQSRETTAIPDSRHRLVGELLGACSHFSLWMDRAAMASLFDFWAQISLELPMGRLCWHPGTDFWTKVDHFLKKGDMPHVLGEEKTLA